MKLVNTFLLFNIIFVFLFGCVKSTQAQEVINQQIVWEQPITLKYEGKTTIAPSITDQVLDNGKPNYYWTKQLKSLNHEIFISTVVTSIAPNSDVDYLKEFSFIVTDSLQIEYKITESGKEIYAVASLFPYILKNGVVNRIISFDIILENIKKPIQNEKSFVTNSVLQDGSGSWYKISVKKDGIYKLDKSFLESCGIDITGLNPQQINIYGNGDGKLPELNSLSRTDDLAKNAIIVFGESDGIFDDTDYILFYGWGPNRWYANGAVEFDQDKNIYSDYSYYFININSSESPLRIQTISDSPSPITNTITNYSFYDVHENDLTSLVKGGQRWYGELFDTELEKTFIFSVPNIVSSQTAFFKTAIATNSASSVGTSQEYSINGTVISTSNLPSVSADYVQSTKSMSLVNPPSTIPFKISITRNSPNTMVYLDRILLNARRSLVFTGNQFNFSDLNSIGIGNVSEFQISSFPNNGAIWEITDRHLPKLINGALVAGTYNFIQETDTLRQFVATDGNVFLTPEVVGTIEAQNLHALPQAEYLIVTHKNFISYANRLADLHRNEGMTVNVVTSEQVYNEFSSGMLDPTAIRMFAKMFFDRGVLNSTQLPNYLLLFGDGTYDPKNRVSNNNNYIPTYQMLNSENHISAMVTDDYYGMLGDAESIAATDMLDIGVGRLLISDLQIAKQQVDKIEHYMKNGSNLFTESATNGSCASGGVNSTFGDWRLNYIQIADDEEGGYFVNQDTEPQYVYVKANHAQMNCDKLYSDAFAQVSTAGGQRYPDVFDAITNRTERGALVMNYVGHGGEVGVAEERIITVPQIQSWKNIDKLNLFVSATCEYTKYDDPSRVSAGEWASLNPYGASIALMTTTRSVFFGVNTITGKRFFENVFTRDANMDPLAFGEILRLTKNASGSSDNKRSFTLIGDPALKLALPRLQIVTDSINGLSPLVEIDTIRALTKMTIKGHIEDNNGVVLTSFNGVLAPSIFDKIKTQYTLGQDADSPIIPFDLQRNIVYKGKASIINGYFEFTFFVPKDINYNYGVGKISYYADNNLIDASGYDTNFIIGGIDPVGLNDVTGPDIELYLNEETFVSGGITDETPNLIAKMFDENGINTVGNGIGHDLMAIIDENSSNPIILNEYYSADLDTYQSGTVNYAIPTLEKGPHTLSLKVWDVNNNSSESSIDFIVQEKQNIELDHVLNYPNPFTTHTEFYFEHNQACAELEAQIQIFTVSGKLVKTINQIVHTEGFRSAGIEWDGRDDFNDQLAKGVYIYSLKVKSSDGKIAEKTEKLVLLR